MKKRISVICFVILAAVAVLSLVGCGECEHTYDHVCDTVCNECGFERTVSGHRYDNDCDTHCNKCNALREVGEHKYTAPCDGTCDICEANREAAEHVYDNACDAFCNACNALREVGEHEYDNACDANCNHCNAERTVGEHEYSYACDSDCDICGFVREAEAHTFDSNCDEQCNVCGEKTGPAANHCYSSFCDTDCDACGEKRITESEHTYSGPCDAECNSCGYVRVDLKHTWGGWVSNGDATCEADGTKTRVCSVCETEESIVEPDSAKGHSFGEYVYNNDATHSKDGTESKICGRCGKSEGTRTAYGTKGHSFDSNGRCKGCGLTAPALSAYMVYESFESMQTVGAVFGKNTDGAHSKSLVRILSPNDGVTYTIVSRGRLTDSNIRALKIARAASNKDTGNDAYIDFVPQQSLASKHVVSFDIMIGSANKSNISFSGKTVNGGPAYNSFFAYKSSENALYIAGQVVPADVDFDRWYSVAFVIDNSTKTYGIYLEGEHVISGIPFINQSYDPQGEVGVDLYRISTSGGKTAVEFYLDNIKLYNGDYAG